MVALKKHYSGGTFQIFDLKFISLYLMIPWLIHLLPDHSDHVEITYSLKDFWVRTISRFWFESILKAVMQLQKQHIYEKEVPLQLFSTQH